MAKSKNIKKQLLNQLKDDVCPYASKEEDEFLNCSDENDDQNS